jgi:NAD(P)-dependent dehydrogenase (short-subunit alcohol dehydrogenase family)
LILDRQDPKEQDMEQIRSAPMAGKTVLVTGASGGIGRATALGLATMGAHVAITGRDRAHADEAAREIGAAGGRQVDIFVADLSSQSEVRHLADEVLVRLSRIDVLINNVGGYWNSRRVTADGLEHTFALNHLAPFLLTNLLVERLKRSPRSRGYGLVPRAGDGAHRLQRPPGRTVHSGARAYNQPSSAQPRPHKTARKGNLPESGL